MLHDVRCNGELTEQTERLPVSVLRVSDDLPRLRHGSLLPMRKELPDLTFDEWLAVLFGGVIE